MDKLEWGWWKKGKTIPTAVGDPRNFTLKLDELEQYDAVLVGMQKILNDEREKVRVNRKTVEAGHYSELFDGGPPRCTTIAHVLDFKVRYMKKELDMMRWLNDVAKRRKEELNVNL